MSKVFSTEKGELLKAVPKYPIKKTRQPWLDVNSPQLILVQGERGSGKSAVVGYVVEQWYENGITIFHLWAARDYENLYYPINKNCKERWRPIKEADPSIEKNFIGCVCDGKRRIPILWLLPDYIKVDQESLDRFNRVVWTDMAEYKELFMKGKVTEWIEKERWNSEFYGKPKPENLQPFPMIKVMHFTVPTSETRKEEFKKQYIDAFLHARREHRIIVMNPAAFANSRDRYQTLAACYSFIEILTEKYLTPLTVEDVGKPRSEWSKWQKSWHKVGFVINELGSVAPTQQMSRDTEATATKREIYKFVPEARHMKAWFIGDYQNPEDIYDKIRPQSNLIIIKRSNEGILGEAWAWFFKKIDEERERIFGRYGTYAPVVQKIANRFRPKVNDLTTDKGYIVWGNREYKLHKFPMPSFHHKDDLDDFQRDTGIRWEIDKTVPRVAAEAAIEEGEAETKSDKKEKKEKEWSIIYTKREVKKIGFPEIIQDFIKDYDGDPANQERWRQETPKNLSNKYNNWKKKQQKAQNLQ